MTSQTIDQLPLGRRDFMQLTLLLPGSLPPQSNSTLDYFRGAVQVNGVREDGNNFMLDGMANRDDTAGVIVVQPSLDAIAEFKILSSTYGAEYGHAGGAQINIITKSGTNQFRGSAFGFLRDDRFDARNFFTPANQDKPEFRLNQAGGSIGGPVVRNKTFFFSNYERRRQTKALLKATSVPSDAMRQGNFAGRNVIYDPATFDPATGARQPFPNNVIPANRISPIAAQVVALLPRANQTGSLNYLGQPLSTDNVDTILERVDHQFNDATRWPCATRTTTTCASARTSGSTTPTSRDSATRSGRAITSRWWPGSMCGARTKSTSSSSASPRSTRGGSPRTRTSTIAGQLGIQGFGADPRDWGMPVTTISGIGVFGDNSSTPQTRYSWNNRAPPARGTGARGCRAGCRGCPRGRRARGDARYGP